MTSFARHHLILSDYRHIPSESSKNARSNAVTSYCVFSSLMLFSPPEFRPPLDPLFYMTYLGVYFMIIYGTNLII